MHLETVNLEARKETVISSFHETRLSYFKHSLCRSDKFSNKENELVQSALCFVVRDAVEYDHFGSRIRVQTRLIQLQRKTLGKSFCLQKLLREICPSIMNLKKLLSYQSLNVDDGNVYIEVMRCGKQVTDEGIVENFRLVMVVIRKLLFKVF